jgi:gamma-glutamyl-gamma-aminobutyrate hydrolase PuuD
MADQMSVEVLETMERHFQRLIDLLNQADQALQEVRVSNDVFEKAHQMNVHKGRSIEEAISDIEKVLAQANNIHNEAVARVREAKEEAAQREDETAEGESTETD